MKHSPSGFPALAILSCLTAGAAAQEDRAPTLAVQSSAKQAQPALAAVVQAPMPPAFDPKSAESKAVPFTAETLDSFIVWASRSNDRDRERVRQALQRAAPADWAITPLYERFQKARAGSGDRALLILSLLGELKSSKAMHTFLEIVWEKPVAARAVVDSELTPLDVQEMMQSRAVEGLAYLATPEALDATLKVAGQHPGLAVRSSAADAYLFNAGDSEDARAKLKGSLRRDELYFLDRVRRSPGTDTGEFNRQLALFYERHPDLVAPKPGDPTLKPEPDEAGPRADGRAPTRGKRPPLDRVQRPVRRSLEPKPPQE